MIAEIIFIFLLTFILVTLLVPIGRYRTWHSRAYRNRISAEDSEGNVEAVGVGATMFFFFLILFPLILAGNYWVTPYGPVFMDIPWLSILTIGLILTLLIAAISPREPKVKAEELNDPERDVATGAAALFGISFFLMLFLTIGVIAAAVVGTA